jgi:Uma2 family endonuclease
MVFFGLITAAEYLTTSYAREPEFVHGELIERSWPTFSHGSVQLDLGSRLHAIGRAQGLHSALGVRMRLGEDLYRIPDIALWTGPGEPGQIPTSPPLLVVEISSPDDRLHDLLQKLDEYETWGVEHIWLVEPELKQFHIYDHGSLREVEQLELPQFGFRVTVSELFQ